MSEVAEYSPRSVKSFRTEGGSFYTYDPDNKTTRFQTVSGALQERQDLTVFVKLLPVEEELIKRAYLHKHVEYERYKVYIAERIKDSEIPNVVRDVEDVKNPKSLFLMVIDGNNEYKLFKPVSMQPTLEFNVFDTRHWKENGDEFTERHLGKKVVEIEYAQK